MQTFALTWKFLLANSPEPYLVPAPWHLLLVLCVLGLLAGAGLHHLIGYTYHLYQVRGRVSRILGLPTLLVLLASTEAALGAYLLAAQADGVVRTTLAVLPRTAIEERVGRVLLEPAFGEGAAPPGQAIPFEGLKAVLLAGSADRLPGFFAGRREALEQTLPSLLEQAAARGPKKGLETPARGAAGLEPETFPLLELLAVRWVGDPDQDWPSPMMEQEAPLAGAAPLSAPPEESTPPLDEPAGGGAPGPETQPPGGVEPGAGGGGVSPRTETGAGEFSGTGTAPGGMNAPAPGEGAATPAPPGAAEAPAGAPAEGPPETTAAGPGGEASEAPAAEPAPGGAREEIPFTIPLFLAGLVAEIPPGVALEREDWENVAGGRFLQWVLEPQMVWQVRSMALIALTLVVAVNLLYFFLLFQVRRVVPTPKPDWRDRVA